MEITNDHRWVKIQSEISVLFEGIYRQFGTVHCVNLVIIPHMKGVLII